jgi:dTDP-4-amino-4,6-dideoxygalactose transaminase
MIPFVDLKAQYASIKDEVDAAIQGVIDSSGFIRGAPLAEFETRFAALHGIAHAYGVASGTDALNLAASALGLGPGDEVITVANTWISTAFAATFVGARPVLVDIDPETYQMDPAGVERAITPATKAVIPVHMFGHPAPMPEILALAEGRGIRVIEDVSQAPLAEIAGRRAGTFGDIGCFSFYPSKNLGSYGDGGAVITDDGGLAQTLKMLGDYGQSQPFRHEIVGYNSRLDTLQAAVLLAKMRYLEQWTEARRKLALAFNERLAGLPVKLPSEAPGARSVYHLYVIQLDRRDDCLAYLRERGVMAQVHYPTPIHLQPCYAALGYKKGDFVNSETLAERGLSLPFFPEMTEAQVDEVVDTLKSFMNNGS